MGADLVLLLLMAAGAGAVWLGLRLVSEDTELAVRLVLALLVGTLLALACLGGLVWGVLGGWWPVVFLVLAVTVGGFRVSGAGPDRRARDPEAGDRLRVDGAVQRLALVAGTAAPAAVVRPRTAPLSWATAIPGRPPAIHVTTGLLDRLDDPQLEAVVAHELAHLMHRDALVMTLLAAAPAGFLSGFREALADDDDPRGALGVFLWTGVAVVPALLLLWTARIFSRHRELVADRTAAVLTGSPAAVAGALVSLSEALVVMRDRDLREVSPATVFHFLPARPPRHRLDVLATHPRLEERLARLQRMERELQG